MTSRNGVITRIAIALLFPMLIIALIMYLSGFRGPITLNNTYYNFMQQASIRANSWNIQIPSIELLDTSNGGSGLAFFDFLAEVINFFIKIINTIIMVLNMILSIFVTIGAIISLLFEYFQNPSNLNQPYQLSNMLVS